MTDDMADLLTRSRTYVEAIATPRDALSKAAGWSESELVAVETAGVLPAATYTIFENAIASPIRVLGLPRSVGRLFYGPAVLHWLRRVRLVGVHRSDLLGSLDAWFAADFAAALVEQAADARKFGWSHLFDVQGRIEPTLLQGEARKLFREWMGGGWAVCLRRWNGRHVVTKDLERARIGAIAGETRRDLSDLERAALFDAIERLDAVILPFAPYERPHGTPGLFIDRVRERYAL